jgi:hypothetical protein
LRVAFDPDRGSFLPVAILTGMGFGSYDESEQENQTDDADIDENDALTVHENDHDGEVTVEGADSPDELVDRLQDLKEQ